MNIKNKIHEIRGKQVILDRDLAELYNVETKRINEAVKRNKKRFPERFCFILSETEKNYVVAKCDHLKSLKYSYQMPYAFTEQSQQSGKNYNLPMANSNSSCPFISLLNSSNSLTTIL